MALKLRPLNQQVIVITGASSGIGLATARLAAARGARLCLAARNEDALRQITEDLNARYGEGCCVYCVADVSKEEDHRRIAQTAIEAFGHIDTWINNAGISIYGRMQQVPMEDQRRLFETNFWGVVHGSRVAVEHLGARGGAIINIGSTLSDRALPLQGMYSASKHAVKGFTDALRMEIEEQGLPIAVTLVKPGAIDTPYRQHAANYLETEPLNPPPVYAPSVAARAILYCAEHPTRDMFVGSGGKMMSAIGYYLPRVVDWVMEKVMFSGQKSGRPPRPREENALYQPGEGGSEEGGYREFGTVRKHSLYTQSAMHPLLTAAAAVGVGVAVVALLSGRTHPRTLAERAAAGLRDVRNRITEYL